MKQIIKEFENLGRHKDLWEIFKDFLQMAAIAISNVTDKGQKQGREKDYLETAKKYTKEELLKFSEILALVTEEMDKEPRDILGEVFMQLELGNKWKGQFFTPIHLAKLMSDITFDDVEIEKHGYLTVTDEAVGGGVTMVALVKTMLNKGYNPQKQLVIECGDLDIKSVYMTYIQLSLLGIPARVKEQDALTQDLKSVWYTPMFKWGGWQWKLKEEKVNDI